MTVSEANESLLKLSNRERAEFVPAQYFQVISSPDEKNRMQPGLIFTAGNLKAIKRYAGYVHRLPKSVDEITGGHGFKEAGIDPEDIHKHYSELRKHVEVWGLLERETKTLGTELELFAEGFISQGDTLIEKLKKTEAYNRVSTRLKDVLDEVSLRRVPSTALSKADQERLVSIDVFIQFIKSDIEEIRLRIESVKARAQWFTDAVVKQLRPQNDLLKARFDSVSIEAQILELQARITPLDVSIQQKSNEYEMLVGYAFSGLVFGPIGVAITGGIYGAQAEAVRHAKNALIDERQMLTDKINALSPMIGYFEATALKLSDLKFRLTEVQTAAKNLEDVWHMLSVYVEESAEDLGQIKQDVQLVAFIIGFERVVRPWKNIHNLSTQLSKLFNEAISISAEGVTP